MNQHFGAHNMTEKIMPHASPQVGAINDARDFRQNKDLLTNLYHSQHWLAGGEGIAGYFGTGCGHSREQGGLASIGIANDADVSKKPHFQDDGVLFPLLPLLGNPGRLVGGTGKVDIAPPSSTTFRYYYLLTRLLQVGKQSIISYLGLAQDQSPYWDRQDLVLPLLTMLFLPLSLASALCPEKPPPAKHTQAIGTGVSPDYDIAALTTITPVWSAIGNKLFPTESDGSIPSISSLNPYFNSINHR
jgi:hypothetical protein